jgi:hypothetical protein
MLGIDKYHNILKTSEPSVRMVAPPVMVVLLVEYTLSTACILLVNMDDVIC